MTRGNPELRTGENGGRVLCASVKSEKGDREAERNGKRGGHEPMKVKGAKRSEGILRLLFILWLGLVEVDLVDWSIGFLFCFVPSCYLHVL
jgi:hypothetical protein